MNDKQINFFEEVRELLKPSNTLEVLNEEDPAGIQPGAAEANPTIDPNQVDGNQIPENGEVEGNPEEMPPEEEYEDQGMTDAEYMQTPDMNQQEAPDITDTRKMVHLFDNFDELFKMAVNFKERLNELDHSFFDDKKLRILVLVLKNVDEISDKLKEYILENFQSKTYEENLYTYMLLRAELLTSIALLRKSLNLGKK